MNKQDMLMLAVRSQKSIPVRADDQKLKYHNQLFINNPKRNTSTLLSSANQLLYGRRGTGKTMLLRQMLLEGQPFNKESSYLAVSLQSFDFLRSPDVTERDPVAVRARSYFREFLSQFSSHMINIGDQILRDTGWLERLGIKNRLNRDIFTHRLLQLGEILQYGVKVPRLLSSSQEENHELKSIIESQSGHEAGIKLGGALAASSDRISDKTQIKAQVNFDSGISSQNKSGRSLTESDTKLTNTTCDCDLGIPEIRNLLREIADTLRVEQVIILLDEWQTLGVCQSEFAEHLKSCFSGIEFLSFKIAAYRHVCKFNNGGTRDNFRGLEIGQDIFEVGDTDLSPTEKNTERFFFEVLYKRLLFKAPDLEKHYGPIGMFDYNQLIDDIFKNKHTSNMLVKGAHGISRDFIEGFNYATGLVDEDVTRNKLSIEHIDRAYGALSRNIQKNLHKADDIGGLLFEVIKPQVHRTGVPFFFIPQQDIIWDEALNELIEKRVLHVLHPEDLPDGADVDWKGYEISYGLFQEWKRALSFSRQETVHSLHWINTKELSPNDFETYTLGTTDSPRMVSMCNSCKKQFSTASHSFITARLCPFCYAPQPKEDVLQ